MRPDFHAPSMTELERFEAAFAALPPLPEEVRAVVLVIWLEVVSGQVDLPALRESCRATLAHATGTAADAWIMDLIEQLMTRREAPRRRDGGRRRAT